MSERTSGTILLMLSRFGWLALQVISIPIYIRTLGDKGYGIAVLMSNVRAFWQLLELSAPQGILQVLSRTFKVDEARAWRYFRTGLGIQFVVGILGFVILALAPNILSLDKELKGHPALSAMCFVIGVQFFLDSYGSTYNLPFMAREQFKKVAALTSFLPTATVLVSIAFVLVLRSPVALLLGSMCDSLTQCFIRFYVIKKHEKNFPILPAFEMPLAKEILKIGLKSYVTDVSTRIGATFDRILIGTVWGKEMLAIYNLACRIPQVLLETFGKLGQAIQPEMTHVAHNEPEKFDSIFKRNFAFVGAVAVCTILLSSGFGHIIGQAWFRKSYEDLPIVVLFMGIYYTLEMLHSTITVGFFAKEKAQYMLPFTLWNSLVTVTCTVPVLKNFGLPGVAAMNLFIDVAQILPIHWYASKYILEKVTTRQLLRITFQFMASSTLAACVAFFAVSKVPVGILNYVLLPIIPVCGFLLGLVYAKLGWIQLPMGIQRKLVRFPGLMQWLGLDPIPVVSDSNSLETAS